MSNDLTSPTIVDGLLQHVAALSKGVLEFRTDAGYVHEANVIEFAADPVVRSAEEILVEDYRNDRPLSATAAAIVLTGKPQPKLSEIRELGDLWIKSLDEALKGLFEREQETVAA